MSAPVTDRVRAVVAETFGERPERIGADATFADLKVDSLDVIELVIALEETFGIEITDDEGLAITGVADTVVLVGRKLGEVRDA